MAVALAAEPELLIADEPTTAIDVTIQAKFLDLIQRLQRERDMSILFITHDLGVIAEVSRMVVVMYLGRVVEVGRVEDIYERPCTPTPSSCSGRSPASTCRARTPLAQIRGVVPDPFSRPPGCPFSDRCPSFVQGTCDAAVPPLYEVHEEHHARCFLYSQDDDER